MERQKHTPPLRGQSRKAWRGSWLLASTALSAVLAHPATLHAQNIPANTTPQGGAVVGGSASIAQTPGNTVITQSSSRAAINWQSYNVGSDAHVTYVQPSSSAIALNRVVTPSPSVIAGHISANGQLVLINQSGVVFTHGAEVTAQSVIVSTSDIKTSDFMAGRMNFTGSPRPGAKIVNDGEITAGQAGLVGLVAPQVANNGLISARFGKVVLAGADAFTLDLYGDKLISLDVTKAVREVDLNGKTVPALVTNKGLILADGGRITLTAADADALVSQLLQVGGTLRADSTEGKTGTISLQAIGGDINIAGNLLARGNATGSTGGNVEALATGKVAVASTAVIDASGQAGGGNIALGTNLQRVAQGAADTTAPRAAVVSIASGAQIKADATNKGEGGKVTLLSSEKTDFVGTISTQGGPLGGNGGLVEISSDGVISLGGTVIDTAIDGQAGEILLDPQTLVVTSASATSAGTVTSSGSNSVITTFGTDTSTVSYVDPTALTNLKGTVILEATTLLSVASAISLGSKISELDLTSGQDMTISASISVAGPLTINAAGTLDIGAALNATTIALTNTGTSSVTDINGVITGTELVLDNGGTVTENASGGIAVTSLTTGTGSIGGDAVLTSALNTIATLANVVTTGTLDLNDSSGLAITNAVSAKDITLAANGTLGVGSTLTAGTGGNVALAAKAITVNSGRIAAPSGTISIAPYGNGTLDVGGTSAGGLILSPSLLTALDTSASVLNFGSAAGYLASLTELQGTLSLKPTLAVDSSGQIIEASTGALDVTRLVGTAGGDVSLVGTNSIDTLGALTATGNIVIDDAGTMTLGGPVSAGTTSSLALVANGLLAGGGSLSAGTIELAPYNNGAIDLGGTAVTGLQISQSLVNELDPAAVVVLGSAAGHAANALVTEGTVSFANTLAALDSTGGIIQTGTLTGTTLSLNAVSLALNGDVNATLLNLNASAGITQASTSALNLTALADVGSTSGSISLGGANSIGTLGALTATGNIVIDDAGTMTLGGPVSAGTTSSLALVANGLLAGGGSLSAGTIELAPYNNGAIDLGGTAVTGLQISQSLVNELDPAAVVVLGTAAGHTANSILTEGTVSFANALATLDSTGGITQTGTLTGTTFDLNAASLALDGMVNATLLNLGISTGITQASTSALNLSTLAGVGSTTGNILLGGTNNIGTLQALTATGNINLQDNATLSVKGAISGAMITLAAQGLTLASQISASGTAELDSSGNLSQSGGKLTAATLTGSVSGNADLSLTQNSIGTLAGFTTGGTLNLTDQTALTQTGSLAAASATLKAAGLTLSGDITATDSLAGVLDLTSNGSLSQSGTLSGISISLSGTNLAMDGTANATTLTLDATNGISQAGTGVLSAATLNSNTTSSGAILLGGTANAIGTLGPLAAGQNILIADAQTGTITARISAGTALTLQGAGYTESGAGAAIAAQTLTTGAGNLSGGLALGGSNTIGTLGALTASGNVQLADTSPLAIAGLVSTPGTLILTSSGAVNEAAGGVLSLGWFGSGTGSIGGAVSLTNANSIGTLGALTATGNIVIDDVGTMTLGGPVSAGTTSSLALVANGLLAGGGSLSAGTIELAPYNNGAIDLGGTAVTGLQISQSLVNELDPAAVVVLGTAAGHTANSILTEGTVSFANALAALDSTGGITQTGTLTGTTFDLNAASLALNGVVNATLLNLGISTGITQASTSALNLSTLAGVGSTTGNILLGGANNIGTLQALTATGNINLQDNATLSVKGIVSAGSSLALSAPTLTLASTLRGGSVSLVADNITDAGGAVAAPGGTVRIAPRTPTLAIDLGGSAPGLDLSGTLLGAITAAALDISTQGSIIADGAASVSTQLLSLAGNDITFAGTLSAPGTLALSSGAGITASSASHLTAGTLLAGGAIAGSINLVQGSNSIGALGSITLNGGSLNLADATALAVNGPLSASAISLAGTSLTLNAAVNTGTLTLSASNGVNQTGGALNVTTLTGSVSGTATFNDITNSIGTLANFTDTGSLSLADGRALTQAGYLSASNATVSATGLNFTGLVTTPGTLVVGSSNGVLQGAGSVNTGVLSSLGTVNGNIIMTQAGDQFPAVRNLAATGVIELTSGTGLSQAGLLSAGAVTLTAPSLGLNGTVSTTGALQLNGGSASEGTGGVVDASLLTTGGGSLSGDAVFNNTANRIASLGAFTGGGGLTLADGTALSIGAPVSLGGTLALWDAGNITQSSDGITAAALTSDGGTVGGSALFGQAGNTIPVLGNFAAHGDLLLNTSGALTVAGNVAAGGTLSLYSGGAIGQSGGSISATRLNASGTSIDLGGTNIGLLGNVSAVDNVSIANAGGLAGTLTAQNATLGSNGGFTASGDARISNALYIHTAGPMAQTRGTISAATATITAPSITLSGSTDVTNALALRANGNIVHESGSLNAGTLTGTAGQLAEFGAATDIGTLGSFLMADSVFMLTNDAPLTLIGPVVANAVSITAAGALILQGSSNGGLFLSGSTIAGTAINPRTGIDSLLAVTGGNPSITQYGTFFVDSGPNLTTYLGRASPLATLFMSLSSSGTIALAPAPGVLNAPNTDLVLSAGATGVASGNVNVLHLEVLSAQSVQMTGSIGSITGPTAAGKGTAFPFPQPGYRFNSCPIGSVNCTILLIEGLPQANPLQNFDLSPRKRRRLDKNVALPGVAERDF